MRKICIPVVFTLLSVPLLAAPPPAPAGAVCAVPSSYPTIQSALYDAGCATIQIAAGTFAENLSVYRSVTLQGAGAGQTILDGSNAGTVIYIQGIGPATAVNISGVTVQHGAAWTGAGIDNYDAAVNLTGSRVANNTGYFQGGGIYNNDHDVGAVEVVPPTPAQQVDALAVTVASLGLDPGSANALTSKLDAATASLAKGNKNAASGQLGAFVNQVKALVKSGRLSSANGAALTAAANAILAAL